MDWLTQLNPWVGSLVAVATVALAYLRLRARQDSQMQSAAMRAAADSDAFRKTLLEHVGYVEDKNRDLERRLNDSESERRRMYAEHSREIDEVRQEMLEWRQRHLECEERLLQLTRGRSE